MRVTRFGLRLDVWDDKDRSPFAAPVLAACATLALSAVFFWASGVDPLTGLYTFYIKPLLFRDGLSELLVKATPLIMCAVGLAVGFRANVWNIGAEGQLTVGAIAGAGVALFAPFPAPFLLPVVLVAGMAGGAIFALIPAALRTLFNASEILVSLMLVYVARLILVFLVAGPWRDPGGFNFPQSRVFDDAAVIPPLIPGFRITVACVAIAALLVAYEIFDRFSIAGFKMRVSGLAPKAAAYAGFGENKAIWFSFVVSGACAGLAGVCEVAGPIGQLQTNVSPGYGFAAIVVAFIGRLKAAGMLISGLLISLFYLGGEVAQIDLRLPASTTNVFQGMMLFLLLAADGLLRYRIVGFGNPQIRRAGISSQPVVDDGAIR